MNTNFDEIKFKVDNISKICWIMRRETQNAMCYCVDETNNKVMNLKPKKVHTKCKTILGLLTCNFTKLNH